jgi:predicted nucleic acid binding AN1-type Zn finger protein
MDGGWHQFKYFKLWLRLFVSASTRFFVMKFFPRLLVLVSHNAAKRVSLIGKAATAISQSLINDPAG